MRFFVVLLFSVALQAADPAEDYARLGKLMHEALQVEESDQAATQRVLRERFPLGMSYDAALKEVRKIRRAFRNNSEYLEEIDGSAITLTLFVYFERHDNFGKEEFHVYLYFDDTAALTVINHSRGSRPL